MKKYIIFSWICILVSFSCSTEVKDSKMPLLQVSENQRFFQQQNGDSLFWLGDTGWLLFKKLTREEAEIYLNDRSLKGFNVVQVMVVHDILDNANVYGDSAVLNHNLAQALTTAGSSFTDSLQYDFWDHVDFIVDLAAEKGIYMAMVPVWGSNVKAGRVTREEAKTYATWLAERYRDRPNIIWLNGGDVYGSDSLHIWLEMGRALNHTDTNHLITFHPFGRAQSSTWFHNEIWLDFNMFQSGHRRYDQDNTEKAYGQDNWRYVVDDYMMSPVKPTLDGEPSYDGIPQGLHDTLQPYWNENDLRRYAYWSVFAGAAGFTYGHNAVMQFYSPEDQSKAYGAKKFWTEAINDPGAAQMGYLKKLMLSKPYFERIPDQSLIAADQGEKYDYLIATRGEEYAFVYSYTGRQMQIVMGKIKGEEVKASWFDPRTGTSTTLSTYGNNGVVAFDPPGEKMEGNDWVLILETIH